MYWLERMEHWTYQLERVAAQTERSPESIQLWRIKVWTLGNGMTNWDINEPTSDLDPPLLRYVANNHRGISNLHGAAKL